MSKIHILHVDDEPDIREIAEISLGLDADFETRSCGSGKEALAVAAVWQPDLVLLDVMMPVMDGPATLACLRDTPQARETPVIFMTARAQSHEIDRFRALGAVGVIPKPFNPMTLAATVRGYIQPASTGLDALRNVFLRRVSDDGVALDGHRPAIQAGEGSTAMLVAVRHIAHGLAGAGGIFGFFEIGDSAAELEAAVNAKLGGGGGETILPALDRLHGCIAASAASGNSFAALVAVPDKIDTRKITARA